MTGFQKAVPVWLRGLSETENVQAVFRAGFEYGKDMGSIRADITAATLYRLRVNGKVAAYGPARAPHGYARIDRTDITELLKEGSNEIEIETAGYYCYSYYTVKQPSFLQAELVRHGGEEPEGGRVICFTGADFTGYRDVRRERKAMRYSFQRTFSEVWDMGAAPVPAEWEELPLKPAYLERGVPMPRLNRHHTPSASGWKGSFRYEEPEELLKDRYIVGISDIFSGYKEDEIEKKPYYIWQGIRYAEEGAYTEVFGAKLKKGEYLLIDLGRNFTGFIRTAVRSDAGCHYMVSFDETLIDGRIDFHRMKMLNLLDYEMPAGERENESFEIYGLRYACVMVTEGEMTLTDFTLRDFAFPLKTDGREYSCGDPELGKIYRAAVETFRQNTADICMDCPTRERAAWLCDSYFTSIAEMAFTGENAVERCFMENYRLYPGLPQIPEGMLPMCYPADHTDGKFIPQWAMWYILELREFLKRAPDADAADYRPLCDRLLSFFAGYENEWGLLEKLPSWNFVEWSKANEWAQDLNYPTNMLYGRMCEIIGEIYNEEKMIQKAARIRETVIRHSYDGKLFCDHAVRNAAGELENEKDISEVCQYYAVLFLRIGREDPFFADTVKTVLEELAPGGKRPEKVAPANDFIGLYMRMWILFDWGRHEQLKEEIKALFGGMTELTGTLWEKRDEWASLNHGFASYVGALIRAMDRSETENANE